MYSWFRPTRPEPLEALLYESIPQTIVGLVLCTYADLAVQRLGYAKSRWFALHAVINLFVVLMTASDTWETLRRPVHALEGPTTTFASSLVIALHLYHAAFFTLCARTGAPARRDRIT